MDGLSDTPPYHASLVVLPGRFALCRLPPEAEAPPPDPHALIWSATRTAGELSLIVPEAAAQAGWQAEAGWRCMQVAGPLDLALTGVLYALSAPLAAAGIPIFALSTYDTDYVLVRSADLARALAVLREAGHRIVPREEA
jgi:hypothetical protein